MLSWRRVVNKPTTVVVVGIATLSFFGLGCQPKKLPGEPIGIYHVVGTLVDNECGSQAVPAENPLVFRVELRADGEKAYWHRADLPVVSGILIPSTGRFLFSAQSVWTAIAADPNLDYPGCTLNQQDTIEGTLEASDESSEDVQDDAGSDAGLDTDEWTGTERIEMTPAAGSNCLPALITAGGGFQSLPCSINYDLLGTLLPESGG